jgi:hypothetical protein
MNHGEFAVSMFLISVVLPTKATQQGCRLRKLMLLFLISEQSLCLIIDARYLKMGSCESS